MMRLTAQVQQMIMGASSPAALSSIWQELCAVFTVALV
jgi:hypothetical protein